MGMMVWARIRKSANLDFFFFAMWPPLLHVWQCPKAERKCCNNKFYRWHKYRFFADDHRVHNVTNILKWHSEWRKFLLPCSRLCRLSSASWWSSSTQGGRLDDRNTFTGCCCQLLSLEWSKVEAAIRQCRKYKDTLLARSSTYPSYFCLCELCFQPYMIS